VEWNEGQAFNNSNSNSNNKGEREKKEEHGMGTSCHGISNHRMAKGKRQGKGKKKEQIRQAGRRKRIVNEMPPCEREGKKIAEERGQD